jgi:hypothetical protein
MGWLFYTDQRIRGHAQEKAEITRICTFENDTLSQMPLRLSKVGSVWYVAVRSLPRPGTSCRHAHPLGLSRVCQKSLTRSPMRTVGGKNAKTGPRSQTTKRVMKYISRHLSPSPMGQPFRTSDARITSAADGG